MDIIYDTRNVLMWTIRYSTFEIMYSLFKGRIVFLFPADTFKKKQIVRDLVLCNSFSTSEVEGIPDRPIY